MVTARHQLTWALSATCNVCPFGTLRDRSDMYIPLRRYGCPRHAPDCDTCHAAASLVLQAIPLPASSVPCLAADSTCRVLACPICNKIHSFESDKSKLTSATCRRDTGAPCSSTHAHSRARKHTSFLNLSSSKGDAGTAHGVEDSPGFWWLRIPVLQQ